MRVRWCTSTRPLDLDALISSNLSQLENRPFPSSVRTLFQEESKARFKRRTLHVPNLMQMSENNRFFSFALDSAHEKFDV